MLLSDAMSWIQIELKERFGGKSLRETYALLLCLERFNTMSQIIMELNSTELSRPEIKLLENWLPRRKKGEPVAYLRGFEYHYGRPFIVDKTVLIPRPETELITQRCIQLYRQNNLNPSLKCLDIGTGSGILALSLRLELPESCWIATDISLECLKIAKKNSQQLNSDVKLIQAYGSHGVRGSFDLIVSNPPYLTSGDPMIQREVDQYEPHLALYAKQDGLKLINEILDSISLLLDEGGYALIEIGYDQHEKLELKLMNFKNIKFTWINDFANVPRILEIKKV